MPPPKRTLTVLVVLHALLSAPEREWYGLEIVNATGLQGGTVYTILGRLEAYGWLSSRWEDVNQREAGRPARRYYRLTVEGQQSAKEMVASSRVQIN